MANNVIEQGFCQTSIVSRMMFLTEYLLLYKLLLSSLLKHPYIIHFLVHSIKVCFHQQNSSEF